MCYPHLCSLTRGALLLGAVLVLSGSATATTGGGDPFVLLSGDVFDGSGGPLTAGTTYFAPGGLTVPEGQTLTVGEGAVVKFGGGALDCHGTLTVQGTASEPVHFTSVEDDSIGGDTGQDGPTAGAPGQWGGLILRDASDASTVHRAVLRFADDSIRLLAADVTVTDTTLADGSGTGLNLTGTSFPTVSGCAFNDNDRPVDNAQLDALVGFANNTAGGNALHDAIRCEGSGEGFLEQALFLSGSATLGPANTLNGDGVVIVAGVLVEADAADVLTLEAGLILKFEDLISVNAQFPLVCSGTAQQPVVFTSVHDDSVGGDTGKDGAAVAPAPGAWGELDFTGPAAGASVLTGVRVRYGSGVVLNAADLTLADSTVELCSGAGLDLFHNSFPAVTGCRFDSNQEPVARVPLEALAGFGGNAAAGNAVTDELSVGPGGSLGVAVSGEVTVAPPQTLNGSGVVLLTPNGYTLTAGSRLTLEAGVVLKSRQNAFGGASYFFEGELVCDGTEAQPVVFTGIADDAFGGDSNLDGTATVPAAGDWGRLVFQDGSDASALRHTIVRFAGVGPALTLQGADVTLSDCRVERSSQDALDLGGGASPSRPTVVGCRFEDNGGLAIDSASLPGLEGLRFNTAAGNALGDHARVSYGALLGGATLRGDSYPGDALVVDAVIDVGAGETLTVEEGVVLKMDAGTAIVCSGSLFVRGTGFEPVVATSLKDDSIGGDTNGDGNASQPQPLDWGFLRFTAFAETSAVEHLTLRYGNSAFDCSSDQVAVRALRVESCFGRGALFADCSADVVNLVVLDAGGEGVRLTGGDFDLVHATVTGSGGDGIRTFGGYLGDIRNTISVANAGENFRSVAAGRLFDSCGSPALAGIDGNIDADPLFADAIGGDLGLQPGSPCIDAADFATALAVVTDAAEASRILDDDLSGVDRPDMGAYERAAYTLSVSGEPRIGTTFTMTYDGPPGTAVVAVGFLDGTAYFAPYGFLTMGAGSSLSPVIFHPVGVPLPVAVPDEPLLDGLLFGTQALCHPAGDTSVGNLTNLYRDRVTL